MPRPQLDEHTPLYILMNAASGSGDAQQAHALIEQVLHEAGRACEIVPIEHPSRLRGAAERAIEKAIRKRGAIVAAGGDGTINAVAHAVLPTGLPFGIIPQGTFNYSSRAHSIPLDTGAATRALLTSQLRAVQVGQVNDRIFLVNASLGLYPQLLQDREHFKQQFGRRRVVAFASGLVTLLHWHGQLALEIEHDREREIVRTPSLFVGNNALQLEQVGLPEAEEVGQRRLAAVVVRPVSNLALVWLAIRGALGQLGDEDRVLDFSFNRMTVRPLDNAGARGMKVATDGEITWMQPPLTFGVAPQPLWLMVPAAAGDKT